MLAGVAVRHGPGLTLALIGVSLLAVPIAWRSKAGGPADAVVCSSADLLEHGKRLPGQLSMTPQHLLWRPSRWAARRGGHDVLVSLDGRPIEIRRGFALLDVVIGAVDDQGVNRQFLTHQSGPLREFVQRLPG